MTSPFTGMTFTDTIAPLDARRTVARTDDGGVGIHRVGLDEPPVLQVIDESRALRAVLVTSAAPPRVDVLAALKATVTGARVDAREGQVCVLSAAEAAALLRAAPHLSVELSPDLDAVLEAAHAILAALAPSI